VALLTYTVAAAFSVPQPLVPLQQTEAASYQFDPSSVLSGGTGIRSVTVYGQSTDGGMSLVRYEISCSEQTFRQLEVREVRGRQESRCTNPSEPIRLKPEKHLVPAALFERYCR